MFGFPKIPKRTLASRVCTGLRDCIASAVYYKSMCSSIVFFTTHASTLATMSNIARPHLHFYEISAYRAPGHPKFAMRKTRKLEAGLPQKPALLKNKGLYGDAHSKGHIYHAIPTIRQLICLHIANDGVRQCQTTTCI